MYRSFSALMDHYAAHHPALRMAAQALLDGAGNSVGALEEIALQGDHLLVKGWCRNGPVTLRCGTARWEHQTDLFDSGSSDHGFEARLPVEGRQLLVEHGPISARQSLVLPLPSPLEDRIARARQAARLTRDLTLGAPRLLASLPKGRQELRRAIKTALRLRYHDRAPRLDPKAMQGLDTADGAARLPTGDTCPSRDIVRALSWLDACPDIAEVPVFVAHAMGGGADLYLNHRLHHAERRHGVVLRMGGADRCRIEVTTPKDHIVAGTHDLSLVTRLIAGVQRRRIVYSCATGDPDPLTIPNFLCALAGDAPLDILFHDYLALSPSYNLLEADGTFRGLPVPDRETPAHIARRPDGTRVPLAEWRAAWRSALGRAERLIVFSGDSRDHVTAAYPDLISRLVVEPHPPLGHVPRIEPAPNDRRVIGVLGHLSAKKGSAVVQTLSHRITAADKTDLVILGRPDPAFPLQRGTCVHGGYVLADLPSLVRHYGINRWLVPSICPETFSYVTQECLMTGLPVIAFDLGAQGEAVRRAPNGTALPIPHQGPASDAAADTILWAARVSAAQPPTAKSG
jgi:hypothetical protein